MTAACSGDVGRASRWSVHGPFCPYSVGTRAQNSGCLGPQSPSWWEPPFCGAGCTAGFPVPTSPICPMPPEGTGAVLPSPCGWGLRAPVRCSPSIYIRLGTSPLCVFTCPSSGTFPLPPDSVQHTLPRTRARTSTATNTWGAGGPILEIKWRSPDSVAPQAQADLLLAFAWLHQLPLGFSKGLESGVPCCDRDPPGSKLAAPETLLALGQ